MVDAQTVYVDDSGTDGKARVAAAAFCVSTVDRWLDFIDRWQKIAKGAGFDLRHFHMTEFAACRRDHKCQQCLNGHTSQTEHPWQRWPDYKRKNVLIRMAQALVNCVECGWGIAHTKEDYENHIRNSRARAVADAPVADSHYTFAVQKCGGAFAEWRAANNRSDRLEFVFDSASKSERHEIANVFFAGIKEADRIQSGTEQWFEPDSFSFESRKTTHQLLAADMVAWTIASVRSREIFLRGRFVEALLLARSFVATEHIKIGYTAKDAIAQWEKDILDAAKRPGISEGQQDDAATHEGSAQRDQSEAGCAEDGQTAAGNGT